MTNTAHFLALQNMYLAAPINAFYTPTIQVSGAEAMIEVDVSDRFFHSAGAVHGFVYFKTDFNQEMTNDCESVLCYAD